MAIYLIGSHLSYKYLDIIKSEVGLINLLMSFSFINVKSLSLL